MCQSVRGLLVASIVCSASANAQPAVSAVAVALPGAAPSRMVERSWASVKNNIDQRLDRDAAGVQSNDVLPSSAATLRFEFPSAPLRDPHDGNYARQGAIVGALVTGVASAVIVGLFAKRDCDPGLCGSEFQRGALVGGGVGLAAGAVLGWLIGAEIARPAEPLPPS
jgi:hypothetical protein